ncbi:CRAL/TRIO domain-containing protein [Patellaria atrata CBS 101060]|uniref:CRAL/TRIO domain-containing protein n=1 Tax=Patellaria atrata CBS 101060 TaxID=1346257 RepID=A0A9P4VN66_9PEZI|nr:CRAL/TRIO domain-containing protein [Patellaria atrata CBS 101060]
MAGTSANDLKKIESFQYPAAHLGHLTEAQEHALEEFKKVCQESGYYKPAGLGGSKEPSHDDETLLRYLRARRFSPPEAFKQFKDTEDWRKENHLAELYDTIDIQEYEDCRRLYPQWTGRRDRRGIPVYVFEVGHLSSKNVDAYTKSTAMKGQQFSSKVPVKMLRLFALYENLCRFVLPLCSGIQDRVHLETPVSQSNNIVDISKVGLKRFWDLKGHMQDASQLATAHYPETLDRIFIIGAPAFFPTVWGWIKRWFDPITVSKIFILSSADMKSTLQQYIDPANIPKKYGGTLDWDFGNMPHLEPGIADTLTWHQPLSEAGHRTIPTGPIKWEESENGDMVAVAVGFQDGKPRREVIATLPKSAKLMHGQIHLDNPITAGDGLTTPGTLTQTIEEGDLFAGQNEPSPPSSGTATPQVLPIRSEDAATAATDQQNTVEAESQRTPQATANQAKEEMRTGTSDAKFEQQAATHAEGQLADGTPAVNDHGHGDKTVTMEPSTVGQAPKDKTVHPPEPASDASYVGQAKAAVGGMVGSVLGAVGMGGKAEEVKPDPVVEKRDERVENADDVKVEAFLREKSRTADP